MRWKMLIVAALVATVAGAGAVVGIMYGVYGSRRPILSSDIFTVGTLLIPVAAVTFASIFIYRHTARRRTLQAMLTALIAIILMLTALTIVAVFLTHAPSEPRPAPTPKSGNVASADYGLIKFRAS